MRHTQIDQPEFSRLKACLWPVHSHEHKKLIPMLLMIFFISFDYNVLRTLKDALVVPASGAEAIPFIKVWAMFPGSILMTYLFARLSNRLSKETVFYVMMGIYLTFFFCFAFILYPMREQLQWNSFADFLQENLPAGCYGLVGMVRYWLYTSFYVMAELWGVSILFILFWGFANQVTRIQEAKRFYGLFGIGGNFSGIIAGAVSIYCCTKEFNPLFPFGRDAWEQSMNSLISLVLLSGFCTILIFRWMNRSLLKDPRYYDPTEALKEGGIKGRMSLRTSFAYLLRSPYLICITVVVISYNVIINLVEVVWKHEARALFPHPQDFNLLMNQVSTVIGVCATLASIFVAGNSIRLLGWTFTAMLTPIILLLTSVAFFGFILFQDNLAAISYSLFGLAPLSIIVFLGSAQNVFSRAAKYTVFDATKEMAFVPLSPESKIKGKAAIDGICSRLGKSGGSVIHQSFLLLFTTLTASAPYVAACLFVIIGIWMGAVSLLGSKFNELTEGTALAQPQASPQPVLT